MIGNKEGERSSALPKYDIFSQQVLHEDVMFKIFDGIDAAWQWFKQFFSGLKTLALKSMRTLRLDEIGQSVLMFLRSLPLIYKILPNGTVSEENKIKAIIGDISIGNGVAIVMNLLQYITSTLWDWLPGGPVKNWLIEIFGYNDKQSYYQALYKIMLDADIPVSYANAFLMIQIVRMPLYIIWYNFKPFWWKGKDNPTEEDKLHPFTAGNPVTDSETGLNEAEQKILKKIQKFIQIKKIAEYTDEDNDLVTQQKLAKAIRNEAIFAFVPLCLLFMARIFRFFQNGFGITKETHPILGTITEPIDTFLEFLMMAYVIYFLVSGIILSSLGIANEETFNPSIRNNSNNTSTEELFNTSSESDSPLIKFNEQRFTF